MGLLIFVHGWSVTSTDTYGRLPARLSDAAAAAGLSLRLLDIRLSEYVSFVDNVTMADLVHAFDRALAALDLHEPFACITHSTGGPLLREWLRAQREHPATHAQAQLSHLMMLAPANYGSALAVLGKSSLGRLKAWWNGIEPGQRILDWLTLGSAASLALNLDHIHGADPATRGQFLFVLSGDRPDRKLYDQLNSYTGEDGSDGVVRLASANLNARHAVLAGLLERTGDGDTLQLQATQAARTAFRLLPGLAHSGQTHGIMRAADPAVVGALLDCLGVADLAGYRALCERFERDNSVRDADKVELEPVGPFAPRVHIHDPRSQLIMRLTDEAGEPLQQTRCMLTAGPAASEDQLPRGFMLDRQAHPRESGVVTLLLNHALLAGDARVADPRDRRKTLRAASAPRAPYGLRITPQDDRGLVHHAVAKTLASDDLLQLLSPHQTTVLDVVLPRRRHAGLFRLRPYAAAPLDFHEVEAGPLLP